MTIKKVYADIAKTEELDDGTVNVWGYASSEAEDSDGETIKADAMKAALPDYMKWANVREMHQPKAAGTAIEAEVQEDGRTWFGAHIVDSEAVKKVKAGVYKGFSIGGKVTGRDEVNKGIITGIKLVEVSLVDRPANPEAVFTVVKADGIEEENAVDELAELINKGEVTPQELIEMVKAAKAGQPADTIEKGMYSIRDFAYVLSELGWICSESQYELDYEGDNSPVPAQLRAWLAQGIEIFKAMAAEETAELLAGLKAAAGDVDVIELAQKGRDLAKAGSRYSKATKAALADIHKCVSDAHEKLAAMGYDKEEVDESESEKAEVAQSVSKANTGNGSEKTEPEEFSKVKAAHGELLKAVGAAGCPEGEIAADFVKALAAKRDELEKRLKELEAKPENGKARLINVSKTEDNGGTDVVKAEPVIGFDGQQNDVATLIKFVHQQGGVS